MRGQEEAANIGSERRENTCKYDEAKATENKNL